MRLGKSTAHALLTSKMEQESAIMEWALSLGEKRWGLDLLVVLLVLSHSFLSVDLKDSGQQRQPLGAIRYVA